MPSRKKTDLLLVVRGDYNDADFVTKITPITQEELDRFLPLIEAIREFKPYTGMTDPKKHSGKPHEWKHDHNWPKGEYGCREDLGEKTLTDLYGEIAQEFDEEYVPSGGDSAGFSLHTIVEIFTVKLDKKVFTASNHYKGWAIL
jgi:hypothetical protein